MEIDYIIILSVIVLILGVAIISLSNSNYYILSITPDIIGYSGDYVYITYTALVPFGTPAVLIPVNYTIYGYKNLVYNLSIGANCSFLMFNNTMFDWGKCN